MLNLPQPGTLYNTPEELKALMWLHFENLNKFVGDKFDKDDKNPNHNQVVSIYFAYKDDRELQLLRKVGLLLLQQQRVEAMIDNAPKVPSAEKMKKFCQKIINLEEKIDKLIEKWEDLTISYKPESAYVTYRSVEGPIRTLTLYQDGFCKRCIRWCRQEKAHKIKLLAGKHLLNVKRAVEPDLIKWENVKYSKKSRRLRGTILVLISLSLLAVCFYGIMAIKEQGKDLKEKANIQSCRGEYPLNEAQWEYDSIIKQGYFNCFCMQNLWKAWVIKFPDGEYRCVEFI